MHKMKIGFWGAVGLTLLLTAVLAGCQSAPGSEQPVDERPLVTVSILPQAYFVERMAGDSVRVNVMVSPGDEPHTYEPSPEQMRLLSQSQIFFSIGVEYEQSWLPRFQDAHPDLRIVDSARGIERIATNSGDHHHGESPDDEPDAGDQHGEEEAAANPDPHVWLSVKNGQIIAANILEALKSLTPEEEGKLQANYEDLIAEMESLDQNIIETLSDLPQDGFLVFHPAWGYFADQYGLEQIPVQIGGQDPSPSELRALVDLARSEDIRVIFVQPAFNAASAEALAGEINAEIVAVDPLARDWLENLRSAADAFAAALEN